MNKDLIQVRFSKTLSSYNDHAKIQKKMAERLMSFLNRNSYKNILEIGCGTGFLTKLVNEKIQFETYTAIDIVENCRDYISDINPEIKFKNADIEQLIETIDNYDLIISNAALQWIKDFEGIVNSLKNKLNQDGELVFSTFGTDNFKEIFQITGITLDYYSKFDLEKMFPKSEIIPEIHIMAFDTPKDVLKHLQATGVNAIENKHWTKKDLSNFEKGYKNVCLSRPTLTYNPIYIKISNCLK